MKKILHITSSIHSVNSSSGKLSDAIIEHLQDAYPDNTVHEHDLAKIPYQYLEAVHFQAFFTPADSHTPEQQEAIRHSNNAIKELKDADIIVIGLPMYNLSIPATLKGWIDQVVRAGETFSYVDNAPVGLLTNKKVFLAISSGSIYSEGAMKAYDFTESYLRSILGFIGLTDLTTFRVEGTAIPGIQETAFEKALATVNEFEF